MLCKLSGGRSSLSVLHSVICNQSQLLSTSLKKVTAISFSPFPFVRTTWLAVQQESPQIPHMDELVSYTDSTWMHGQFKRHQWNNFKGPRTNNHVEGYSNFLKINSYLFKSNQRVSDNYVKSVTNVQYKV